MVPVHLFRSHSFQYPAQFLQSFPPLPGELVLTLVQKTGQPLELADTVTVNSYSTVQCLHHFLETVSLANRESDREITFSQSVDITPEGLMLISEQPAAVGDAYTLEVRLPDTEGALQPMRFKAVCRWSDNDINADFYDSGFEFLDRRPEDIDTIRELVESYGFHD